MKEYPFDLIFFKINDRPFVFLVGGRGCFFQLHKTRFFSDKVNAFYYL